MDEHVARTAARPISIARHPIYAMLLPVPIVCFIGALVTDLAYRGSGGNLLWLNFSSWLIAAGLVFGAIAGARPADRCLFAAALARWPAFALLLAALDRRVHQCACPCPRWLDRGRSAPGLILSIVGAVLILIARLAVSRPAAEVRAMTRRSCALRRPRSRSPAAATSQNIDPSQQVGPNPVLPEAGRGADRRGRACPRSSAGSRAKRRPFRRAFASRRMATGLSNPRTVYPLANGDILVVESQRVGTEPVDRPKDPIRDFIMSMAHGGGGAKETAGARADRRSGSPCCATPTATESAEAQDACCSTISTRRSEWRWSATISTSPNTDAILRYPFTPGQTTITAPGQKVDRPSRRA